MNRDFDTAAKTWDKDEARLRMSTAIADAMVGVLDLAGGETVLDYGTGTGTVAFRFVPLAKQVIAADSSRGMLDVLDGRIQAAGATNIRSLFLDLERDAAAAADLRPDVITSAMALHHISDTAFFAAALARLLPTGGKIAIADLDTEAGDFHADNTGVQHFGFDRDNLARLFAEAGFKDVRTTTAYDFVKPTTVGEKSFPIFLLSARKG